MFRDPVLEQVAENSTYTRRAGGESMNVSEQWKKLMKRSVFLSSQPPAGHNRLLYQETTEAEFSRKRREMEEQAEAKTARNRAKREKKKERAKTRGPTNEGASGSVDTGIHGSETGPTLKKRRLINGKELVFRQPGDESDDEEDLNDPPLGSPTAPTDADGVMAEPHPARELPKITIHEE